MKNARRGVLAILVTLAACSENDGTPAGPLHFDPADVLFIAQNAAPTVVMEALFTGRVIVDHAGCVRLDSAEPATVVWPKGFRLVRGIGAFHVLDAAGRSIGRIRGPFRFGGGEVPYLHDGIAVTAQDRQRATVRCPGRYWIVGDVPAD